MPGAVTTKTIKDASGNNLTMRVWDESGVGAGPFSFFSVLGADGAKLAKAEDAASASGDEGIVLLAKRASSPANSSDTNLDYEPIQMDGGYVWFKPGATETHLGEVGGKTVVYSVTLSTDTAAYASGDLIADTQQLNAFFRKTDGTGIIQSLTITDEEAQGVAMYVLFMKTSTSLGSENSAPNITDANLSAGFIGMVAIETADWITVSGAKVACIRNIGLPVMAVSGTDDLYIAVLNSTGSPDWDADSLVVQIGALLD